MKKLALLVIVLMILLVAIVVLGVNDQRAWEKYAAEHHCVAKGTKVGQVTPSVTSDGKIATGIASDQTVYVCDNGEIVIR